MELSINKFNNKMNSAPYFKGAALLNARPARVAEAVNNFSQSFDTFIKKENISEKEEKNLVNYFAEKIGEWISNGVFGSGEHNLIYKIEEGKYLLKLPRNAKPNIDKIVIEQNEIGKNLKTYKGHTVANIGNIRILQNAGKDSKLIPAGCPKSHANIQEMMRYYNEVYLPKFSSLPQSSFDDVAADFSALNKSNYTFDTINPNNFQVGSDGKIVVLDDLEKTSEYKANSLSKMFRVFTNSLTHDTQASFDILAVGNRRNLFKKIILAAEKNELPYGSSMNDREELNLAMRLCNFEEPFSEIQRTLTDYRRKYPDMDVRLSKIKDYLNEFGVEDTRFNSYSFYE